MKTDLPKFKQNNMLRLIKVAAYIKDVKARRVVLTKLAKLTTEGMAKEAALPAFLIAAWPWIAGALGLGATGWMGYEAYKGHKQRGEMEDAEKQRNEAFKRMMQQYHQQRSPFSQFSQNTTPRERIFIATPREQEEVKETPVYRPYSLAESRRRAAQRLADQRANKEPVQTSTSAVPGSKAASFEKKAGWLGALLKLLGYGVKPVGKFALKQSPRLAQWLAKPGVGQKAVTYGGKLAGGIGDIIGMMGAYEGIGEGLGWALGDNEVQEDQYYPQQMAQPGMGGYSPQEIQQVMSTLPPEVRDWSMGGGLSQYQPQYSMNLPRDHDLTEVTPDNYAELSKKYHLPENLFGPKQTSQRAVPGASASAGDKAMKTMMGA